MTFALALFQGACLGDAAHREYIAALRGDEDDSTYEQRIDHLNRALTLKPERGEYWESRALLRIGRQDFAAARADLDQAIERGDRPYLRFLKGLVLCQSGDCSGAPAEFDRAIAEQPENSQFYRGRGLALVELGRPAEGLADAERLIALAPQMATSYYVRGRALAALGRHAEALRDFEQAARMRPELVYPLLARADAYDALGDTASARSDRATAARKGEGSGCGNCLDPFRY